MYYNISTGEVSQWPEPQSRGWLGAAAWSAGNAGAAVSKGRRTPAISSGSIWAVYIYSADDVAVHDRRHMTAPSPAGTPHCTSDIDLTWTSTVCIPKISLHCNPHLVAAFVAAS